MATAKAFAVGTVLGDYVIEAEIGGGGMATVYRGKHRVLDSVHALKVLEPRFRDDAEARRRFLDEGRIQAKLLGAHPGVVRVTSIVATDEAAALVMDFVDGPGLDAWIAGMPAPPGEAEFLKLALPILAAIGHAHRVGIIHRDIKPGNVLLAKRDGELVPMVTDFGIAKVVDGDDGGRAKKSTHADARMGTLAYMSPEQVHRAKDVTARSDVFSLGALLYELASKQAAFDGGSDFQVMERIVHGRFEPLAGVAPQLPGRIVAAITRALAAEPAERFASCEDFARAMRPEEDKAAVPVPMPPALVTGSRALLWLGLGLGLGAVGGAGITYVATRPKAKAAPVVSQQPVARPSQQPAPSPVPVVVVQPSPSASALPTPSPKPATIGYGSGTGTGRGRVVGGDDVLAPDFGASPAPRPKRPRLPTASPSPSPVGDDTLLRQILDAADKKKSEGQDAIDNFKKAVEEEEAKRKAAGARQ